MISQKLLEAKKTNKKVDLYALAGVINTSWGKSSTVKSPVYSVKARLAGANLILTMTMVVSFMDDKSMHLMKQDCEKESLKISSDGLKMIKKEYKEEAGAALGLKELESHTEVEYIHVNIYNPKKTAYFRRITTYELT